MNDQMAAVARAFRYLARKGIICYNPCLNLGPLPQKPGEKKTHGCYKIEDLKGVFDKGWEDRQLLLLNLMMYTTNMRNCEILRFCKQDIMTIEDCRFIDIKRTKSENGVRLVPLHEKVYQRIMDFAEKTDESTPVFSGTSNYQFSKAYHALGKMMGVSDSFLKENNITFYSGRHAWKTLMNSEGLGIDIEEVFMGHKVSGNVAELYNHRDKQGKEKLVTKAQQVFAILDRCIFSTEP